MRKIFRSASGQVRRRHTPLSLTLSPKRNTLRERGSKSLPHSVAHWGRDLEWGEKLAIGLVALSMVIAILACSRPGTEKIIYVTATFPGGERVLHETPTPSEPTERPLEPTPDPTRPISAIASGSAYSVQPGDTLAVIAARAGTTLEALMSANGILDPNLLEVGQVLVIPNADGTVTYGAAFKIIPDSELVYSPSAASFDVPAYLKLKNGFIRAYSEEAGNGEIKTAVEMVVEVAQSYSVNPRLLLALLEYRGKWLSETSVSEDATLYPFGLIEPTRSGLYKQLLDTADLLSVGYYGWKYRGFTNVTFADGRTVTLSPTLNPGTAGVVYFLSKYATLEQWQLDVSEQGFFQMYLSMFGDPFRSAYEPMLPADLRQPTLEFPFPPGEIWFYTGGPHGGYDVGSAWASVDFAPPMPPETYFIPGSCYVSPYFATAAAPGVIARSGEGFAILDLDFDGNEHTGWTIVYLHIEENENLAPAGTILDVGEKIGQPSCMGGFSQGTHMHIARRYNGEWIPVDCYNCPAGVPAVPFVMSGWTIKGYEGQEYQGFMENTAGEFRRAEVGRTDPINQLRWLNK